ncbi:DinB family protein [Flavobacterium sp. CLA17]|uniref:DinB family protein n=1 Tax=Flavobacterium sp. CLA17 TaxID=2724135 RepID=UPI001492AE88|nr:DinB family protein [Flavobacterium sp. CLA17]QSB28866.1 DinB family protein [Flavobacterium sp. CLA17]
MKTELQKNVIETFKDLNHKLASFSETELNTVPFEGSWTAGQVIQHLIMGCSGFPKMCAGKTEKKSGKPDEKVKDIEALFFNYDIKMKSPEAIIPSNITYNKNSLALSLLKIEKELLNVSETCDLTLTCLDFEIPGFGKFTIYEWVSFALIHIRRHLSQLQTIGKVVTEK